VKTGRIHWLQPKANACDIDFNTDEPGWLVAAAAPTAQLSRTGHPCLSAVRAMNSLGKPARNDSKGCRGVMRGAPVDRFAWRLRQYESPDDAFRLGIELAALTDVRQREDPL